MNLEIDATVTFRTQFPRAVPVDERTVGLAFEAVPALQLLAATQGGGTVDEGYVALRAAQGRRRCVGIHGDDYRSPRRRGCHRHLRFFPQSFRHLAATVPSAPVSAAPRWCRSPCTARSAARTPMAARRPARDGNRTSDNAGAGRLRMLTTTRLRGARQLRQQDSWLPVSPRTVPRSWSPKCSGIRSLHGLACATTRHDTVRHETRETPAGKRGGLSNGDHAVPSDACAQQMKCFGGDSRTPISCQM